VLQEHNLPPEIRIHKNRSVDVRKAASNPHLPGLHNAVFRDVPLVKFGHLKDA
jgi:hypothetical protein